MMPMIITGLIPVITQIFNDILKTPEEKSAGDTVIDKLQQNPDALMKLNLAQSEITKIDAQSESWINRCWRPFIGWCCALAIFNEWVLNYWFYWFSNKPLPQLDMGMVIGLTTTLLGMAGLRTYEKINVPNRSNIWTKYLPKN